MPVFEDYTPSPRLASITLGGRIPRMFWSGVFFYEDYKPSPRSKPTLASITLAGIICSSPKALGLQ